MVSKTIAKFEVKYLQIMDEKGNIDEKLMSKMQKIDNKTIIEMYKIMVKTKLFDERMLKLQRQGRIGTFASVRGQEAQAGAAFAMKKSDWLVPAFRETVVELQREKSMVEFLLFYGGDERGNRYPPDKNNLPIAVPVGTQCLHGCGIAWAAKLKGDKIGVVCFFGDGATSEGDFHEAMNFAGVFKVPCVFICQNNQWAISVPRSRQSAAKTLAQKAIAYEIEGIQIDGNDVFAVYSSVKKALEKARAGKGPTMIEMFTYRLGDHTTADDASRYRSQKEVNEWKKKDPIDRLYKFLVKKKLWSKKQEEQFIKECEKEIDQAVKEFESTPMPKIEDVFKYTFAEIPGIMKEQMEEMKRLNK